jgi:hypothetical protein
MGFRREDMCGAVHFWLSSLYFWGSARISIETRRNGFIGANGSASNISTDLFRNSFIVAMPSVSDMSTEERCLKGMTGAVADIASIKMERFTGAKSSASFISVELFRKGFIGAVPSVSDMSTEERFRKGMTGAVADIAFTKIERSRIGWAGRRLVVSDTTMDRCRQGITGGVPRAMDTRRISLTGAVSISLGSSKTDIVDEISMEWQRAKTAKNEFGKQNKGISKTRRGNYI